MKRRSWLQAIALLLIGLITACRTGIDYPSTGGPRHAGAPRDTTNASRAEPETLRVVSFNIEFARRIDAAIALLTSDSALRDADVILLQEMDAAATKRIADTLGMWFVYYPALFHRRTRRDFGNAVLARWPIVDDAKLVLPHPSRYAGTHRIATAATLHIGASRVRVYSTHLGTIADIGSGRRREQLRAILADAAQHPFVVIGGDFNETNIGRMTEAAGYTWPTQHGPPTTRFGRWDHIFLKGLASPRNNASGTVVNAREVSDHRPVWALALLRPGNRGR